MESLSYDDRRKVVSFTIELPASTTEETLINFVKYLARGNSQDEIILDFQRVTWITPGAVAALVATVRGWAKQRKRVSVVNHQRCPVSGYLQRFDLFNAMGIRITEHFRRHTPGNRFVPVHEISRNGSKPIETLYSEVASVLAPEESTDDDWETGEAGAYGFFEHAVSELGNNVLQHSRSLGYVCAQHYPSNDVVRISIADCGIGIRRSFEVSESPHWHEGMTDREALEIALQPHVSSKLHLRSGWGGEPVNAGVGLSVLNGLAQESKGKLLVISGGAFYTSWGGFGNFSGGLGYNGTLCAFAVLRSEAMQFTKHLRAVNARIRPLLDGPNTFDGVFR